MKLNLKKSNDNIVILAIGNEMLADDSAGIFVAEILLKKLAHKKNIKIFKTGVMPESFFSKISAFKPSLIIFIDACSFGGKIGEIRHIPMDKIDGAGFSTHSLPITTFVKYLTNQIPNIEVQFIGIEPKSIEFDKPMTTEIKKSCQDLAGYLIEKLS
ncbi:MAG: hydrogenase 3 maturation endopeptidase HyCI [Elusimicrobiaceae bacterium]|jgi:hydrogenase 3 maturation protease|nr:hydrogenase 3 maturation endopeptidase HyCI [Elusimicrobiaceae bacterium]MBT3955022.1 hydrogenase 3 maturation endopeptidase HyCI [Elusimicrobiaceae bacterium]MBT4008086.1 hydrogenase 3 maturation endopeptidase HyCI [Elusimicrobiaceae bacterium]MBT4402718.1 hydrogenase 3 maturation endopeptidase HyCI [Elusimicrobiaceae bacterium]MBT4439998.1 hydrogenase 3 maturation endopeptidase HyCI [Elusimicrobiaceae bacterium]